MAGTRVPGEGETPAEMEQEMSLRRLQERNTLWKVGGTCRLGAPRETPTPLGIGEAPAAIRA